MQNVQADAPIGINVGVVNLRLERKFRGLEWIITRERDIQEEDTTSVRRIALQKSMEVAQG